MTEAVVSAGAASPDEFYDAYTFNVDSRSLWARGRARFFRHRLATASLFILVLVFSAGLLAGHLAPYGYLEINPTALSAAPSWAHPFGTDQLGRDYFSRVLYGIGTEAQIVLLVAFFGTMIGTLIGVVCGYFGGAADNLLMRLTDLFLTLPPLITVLVAATYLHANTLFKISALLAALLWMPIARIVRGTSLSLREREYVEAARAMGASDLRIIARHILPNAIGSATVAATVMTAGAVILETTLSYLGVGLNQYYASRTDTSLPSLGDVMAAASQEGLFNWWGVVFPGLAVVFIIAPIYFIGDGIRDALDPTGRVSERPRRPPRRKRTTLRLVSGLLAALPRPSIPDLRLGELAGGLRLPRVRLDLPFVGGLASRIRRREAGRRRLLLEALAVLLVTGAVAGAVYVFGVNPVDSSWGTAGTQVQNVSRARGAQTEIAVTIAQSNPRVLFAASNDSLERTIRVYSSTDGGRSWSSQIGPSLGLDDCARGEPAVSIARDGREYVAFIVNPFCAKENPSPYLVVASRDSTGSAWQVRRVVARSASDAFDAKPAIAAAPDGRVYVAWSRLLTETYATTVISSSSDGGRTWWKPRIVSRQLVHPQLVSVTVDPRGRLYLAGVDARFGIWVGRSTDRARGFIVRRAAALPGNQAATCAFVGGKYPIPVEATHCLGPNPTITATSRRVYVTYAVVEANGTEGIRIAVLDGTLRSLWRGRVGPPEGSKADQFFPASAIDLSSERLWTCYYDTSGDPSREKAWFSCSVSRDGREWTTPVRATEVSANRQVLVEDARIYGFGDMIGYGGYTGLAVANGMAHPMWVDTRDLNGGLQEVFSARVSGTAVRRPNVSNPG